MQVKGKRGGFKEDAALFTKYWHLLSNNHGIRKDKIFFFF